MLFMGVGHKFHDSNGRLYKHRKHSSGICVIMQEKIFKD